MRALLPQALIAAVGGPLLSHSVHVPSIELSDDEYLVPDTGALMDMYGSRGLDFIVEVGQRKTRPTSVSVFVAQEAGRELERSETGWSCRSGAARSACGGWLRLEGGGRAPGCRPHLVAGAPADCSPK